MPPIPPIPLRESNREALRKAVTEKIEALQQEVLDWKVFLLELEAYGRGKQRRPHATERKPSDEAVAPGAGAPSRRRRTSRAPGPKHFTP